MAARGLMRRVRSLAGAWMLAVVSAVAAPSILADSAGRDPAVLNQNAKVIDERAEGAAHSLADFPLELSTSRYSPTTTVDGALISIGSDTFANLITLWAQSFRELHPGVTVQVQAPGSSTAPTALAQGTANLGPMSRRMKAGELEVFERRFGYRPTAVRVAIDALAVYVHKDNPLTELSLDQIDALFSVNRRCGLDQQIQRWGDLGLTGSWARRPIALFGRNSVSGTYGYFKQVALCSGDFRATVNEQPGSASVVQAIGSTLGAIGFSGIGYDTTAVRPLALAEGDEPAVLPTALAARSGDYPLTRYLYFYVNRPPDGRSVTTEIEFLRFVLSREGQSIVAKDGYIPLPPRIAERELRRLR